MFWKNGSIKLAVPAIYNWIHIRCKKKLEKYLWHFRDRKQNDFFFIYRYLWNRYERHNFSLRFLRIFRRKKNHIFTFGIIIGSTYHTMIMIIFYKIDIVTKFTIDASLKRRAFVSTYKPKIFFVELRASIKKLLYRPGVS